MKTIPDPLCYGTQTYTLDGQEDVTVRTAVNPETLVACIGALS